MKGRLPEIILNNPFRILGLNATSSEKEIAKRCGDLAIFAEMGKKKRYDSDLELYLPLERTPEAISTAAGLIEQPENRVFYSLFWFSAQNATDEMVLETLNKGQGAVAALDKAGDLWRKVASDRQITERNFSAARNLHVLHLLRAFPQRDAFRIDYLEMGVSLLANLLESGYFPEYSMLVGGVRTPVVPGRMARRFADEIFRSVGKGDEDGGNEKISSSIIQLFSPFADLLGDYAVKKVIGRPMEEIESAVQKAELECKGTPKAGVRIAEQLDLETREAFSVLKRHLRGDDLQFQMIADNLALGILDCSIACYNAAKTARSSTAKSCLALTRRALEIAAGDRAKKRIQENLTALEEIVADLPNQERMERVEKELEKLTGLLAQMEDKRAALVSGKIGQLLAEATPLLKRLKQTLGSSDEIYRNVSNAVASRLTSLCIDRVNQLGQSGTADLPMVMINMTKISDLDMQPQTRSWFDKNMATLRQISSRSGRSSVAPSVLNRDIGCGTGCFVVIGIIIFLGLIGTCADERTRLENNHSSRGPAAQVAPSSPTTPAPSAPVVSAYRGNRLKNGASPYDEFFGRGVYRGASWIDFVNGTNTDAVVCLVNQSTGKTIRNEYIRAGTTYRMSRIPSGTYYIKTIYGNDWNPDKRIQNGRLRGGFDTSLHFSVSDRPGDWIFIDEDSSSYTTGSITLHTSTSGNMGVRAINEGDFFK